MGELLLRTANPGTSPALATIQASKRCAPHTAAPTAYLLVDISGGWSVIGESRSHAYTLQGGDDFCFGKEKLKI